MALFELYRGSAPGSAVAPLWVVEHLDVIEYTRFGLVAARIDLATYALAFEQLEEALGHSVVVTVPPATHAGNQVVIA